MTPAEFRTRLEELTALPTETEWVEFKRNDRGAPMYAEIGEYLSAIANSLALLRRDRGYSRREIDSLLLAKLSDVLTDDQKKRFVENLLQEMRRQNAIESIGSTRGTKWRLPKPSKNAPR